MRESSALCISISTSQLRLWAMGINILNYIISRFVVNFVDFKFPDTKANFSKKNLLISIFTWNVKYKHEKHCEMYRKCATGLSIYLATNVSISHCKCELSDSFGFFKFAKSGKVDLLQINWPQVIRSQHKTN